ncbi:3-methyladenine DNA glycosylase AlkD [Dysgonomonas alginatilytica]|uniref:3-methyladenine DNA glycosylase AlkD n=1 Tax=Dysgonomonas alginatilytica TaxID=1605892 RepID=A0A2V3PSF6_9BACT|nr:DNA alkylation repair protein [Dysgonomonas alginatilytica]PXV68110.1 3-methyladenine DNA glycosylase AlkD [Dysgonomonas alginatilytica]
MQEEIIRDIRKRCRMAMNGVASASMRGYGLNYKLNFGVSIQKIKEIASRYESDKNLAETLWLDGTRELKILATLLYPIDQFSEETANEWVHQIPNQEIREQVCVNLFQTLDFSDQIGLEWINKEDGNVRATGYWLIVRRLLAKKFTVKIEIDTFQYIWKDIISENISLRNAAILFLKNAGKFSPALAENILEKVTVFKDSEDPLQKEIYDSLSFEFEFLR